jgi:hypothetical protein
LSLFFRYGRRTENLWCASDSGCIAARFVEIETEAADQLWRDRLDRMNADRELIQIPPSGCLTRTEVPHRDYMRKTTELNTLYDEDPARPQTVMLGCRQYNPASAKVINKVIKPLYEVGNSSSHLFSRRYANFGIPELSRVFGMIVRYYEKNGRWVTFFRKLNLSGEKWESWDEFIQFK